MLGFFIVYGIKYLSDMVSYNVYGVTMSDSDKLRKKFIPQLKKHLKKYKGWKLVEVHHVKRSRYGDYECYVEIINLKKRDWTNDFVEFDKEGKIIKEDFCIY